MEVYKKSGVDIDKANSFVNNVKKIAQTTFDDNVVGGIGGFSGLYSISKFYKNPILVSSTDGVGTKLEIAATANLYDTIGIDLVAMCVNDIITCGAKPLFFLDYFATGKLDNSTANKIIRGIANGCKEAECALIGGETAEMPGIYPGNLFDLAGFCVGIVERNNVIDGTNCEKEDVVIGIASNGVHSNGFSLIRNIIASKGINICDFFSSINGCLADILLQPTTIYVKLIHKIINRIGFSDVHALCHITGGGLLENLPRVVPQNIDVHLDLSEIKSQKIFAWIKDKGKVSTKEMHRVFNMGVGFCIIVNPIHVNEILTIIEDNNEKGMVIGTLKQNSTNISKVHLT